MTRLLPQTTNLYAPVSVYLSLDDLISSDTAHDLISISGPFIPTLLMIIFFLLIFNKIKRVVILFYLFIEKHVVIFTE